MDQFTPKRHPWLLRSNLGYNTVPVVQLLNTVSGRVAGGITVTITGLSFRVSSNGSQPVVRFGSTASPTVVVVDSTHLTAVTPLVTDAGLVDVSVTIDGQTGTLANAFTYIAGFITSISPNYSLVSGGAVARIYGGNFLNGSTITFGGAAVAVVQFVDVGQFFITIPAHSGAGPVDIVITEPSAVTVTGSGLFIYTAVIPAEDVHKNPSVTVHDALNNSPNTCSFTVDGGSSPPVPGTGVEFTDDGVLIFSGIVQSSEQVYEGLITNRAWRINAIDRTFLLNRKRPFGTYDNIRANDIVIDLINKYAPEFTTEYVQTNLAHVSASYDGTQDFATILSQLAGSLGEGHWYVDYWRRVHFYHLKPFAIPVSQLPSSALQLGPGTPMVVTESTTPITGQFEPGWYYFKSTSEYGTSTTYGTPLVAAPSNYVLLSNQAAALNLLGQISNGTYSDGTTFFPRGWAGYNGVAYMPTFGTAPGGNVVYFASPDVAAVLEAQANSQFESAYSPISNVIYLAGAYRPTFTGIPVAPAVGAFSGSGRRIYFIRLSSLSGLGGTRTTGYLTINDNATTTITAEPTISFDVQPVPFVNIAAAPIGTPVLAESATSLSATDATFQSGYYSVVVSGVYEDGTESYPSAQSPAVLLSGANLAKITAIPTFTDINSVPCIFRKIYVSYTPLVTGIPDFLPGHTNLTYIITDNTNIGPISFSPGLALSGGDGDPSYPVGVPLGVATSTNNVDGPWLEDDDKPTDIDYSNPYILHDPPLSFTSDYSQIRNRVFVKGKGTTLTVDAGALATSLSVGDVSSLSPTGGKIIIGSRVLAYNTVTAVSSAIGSGSGIITLAQPLALPVSTTDWKYGGGQPIRPFIQVDDVQSQQAVGLVELDSDGNPTDGIHEYTIDDNSLATTLQCISRGLAELQLFSRPIIRLQYSTRDPLSRSGKIVTVNRPDMGLVGDFIIQEVTIDQYHDQNNQLAPRYNVQADNAARFNLNDLFLYLDDRASKGAAGGPSLAGVGSDGNFFAGGAFPVRRWIDAFIASVGGYGTGPSLVVSRTNISPADGEVGGVYISINDSFASGANMFGYSASDEIPAPKRPLGAVTTPSGADDSWMKINTLEGAPVNEDVTICCLTGYCIENEFDAWFYIGTPKSLANVCFWVGMMGTPTAMPKPPNYNQDAIPICALQYTADTAFNAGQGWRAVMRKLGSSNSEVYITPVAPILPKTKYIIRVQAAYNGVRELSTVTFTVNGVSKTISYSQAKVGTTSVACMPTANDRGAPAVLFPVVSVISLNTHEMHLNFRQMAIATD